MRVLADQGAAIPAAEDANKREGRHHEQDRGEAGQDEDAFGRNVHRHQRVDLLVNLHRRGFGGDGGAHAAGDQDGHHHGTEFAHDRQPDQRADKLFGAEVLHAVTALERQHAADEEGQDRDDRQGGEANEIALLDEPTELPRQRVQVLQGLDEQQHGAADVSEDGFQVSHGDAALLALLTAFVRKSNRKGCQLPPVVRWKPNRPRNRMRPAFPVRIPLQIEERAEMELFRVGASPVGDCVPEKGVAHRGVRLALVLIEGEQRRVEFADLGVVGEENLEWAEHLHLLPAGTVVPRGKERPQGGSSGRERRTGFVRLCCSNDQ